MDSDERLPADSPRRFMRFGVASLFVLAAAIGLAIAIGFELSKTEVSAYIEVARTIHPPGLPRSWYYDMSDSEYDSFRRTQVELLRSKVTLTRAVRDPSVLQATFLAQVHDPMEWLEKNLRIDYPNDAELLRVRLFTHEPDDGVKIVDAVVHAYFRELVEKGTRERDDAERQLRAMCDELTDQVIREKKETQSLEKTLAPRRPPAARSWSFGERGPNRS